VQISRQRTICGQLAQTRRPVGKDRFPNRQPQPGNVGVVEAFDLAPLKNSLQSGFS